MLMRRRWDANQTLDTGTLMVDTAQSVRSLGSAGWGVGRTRMPPRLILATSAKIDANEQSFEDVRFAPPDAPRSRLSSASGHSMGR